ncbi:ABC transporter ATP-binding protein [Nonomuraea sp. NPDC050536]|uniref:ABC transporter ATP-binding protein n=1 Tax=Nonomuraea sp. NPDC050536 TaxID=3364366 RepID=UPI0037C9C01E
MLKAENLTLGYGGAAVVHGVTLDVTAGGVGLIGESGSGKTTVARALLGLLPPMSGGVTYGGRDVAAMDRIGFRGAVQPVFQDGSEALNPRMRVAASLREALRVHRKPDRIAELLDAVDLDPALAERRPHELSGGQRQRVIIARALAVEPTTLVLDEPTSALDVTVQARVLDLLESLAAERDLRYLLITHNLAVVHRLCRTSHVMFAGRIVESGPTRTLLTRPAHPYTAALRAAVPRLGGSPPAPAAGTGPAAPDGCAFRLRCPLAMDRCAAERPEPREVTGRTVACHRAEEVTP